MLSRRASLSMCAALRAHSGFIVVAARAHVCDVAPPCVGSNSQAYRHNRKTRWMIQSQSPKALQASACEELLGLETASCQIHANNSQESVRDPRTCRGRRMRKLMLWSSWGVFTPTRHAPSTHIHTCARHKNTCWKGTTYNPSINTKSIGSKRRGARFPKQRCARRRVRPR